MPLGRSLAIFIALSALAGVAFVHFRDSGPAVVEPANAGEVSPPPKMMADTPGGPWNAAQIDWQSFDSGLALAKSTHKPICLVISTTWCPHCKNFSRVFEDPKIVARARELVMVHIDSDVEEATARKYAFDGGYIPRTFFLKQDGTADTSIQAPRDKFRYFYDESDPSSLLGGMTAAIAKLK